MQTIVINYYFTFKSRTVVYNHSLLKIAKKGIDSFFLRLVR